MIRKHRKMVSQTAFCALQCARQSKARLGLHIYFYYFIKCVKIARFHAFFSSPRFFSAFLKFIYEF